MCIKVSHLFVYNLKSWIQFEPAVGHQIVGIGSHKYFIFALTEIYCMKIPIARDQ